MDLEELVGASGFEAASLKLRRPGHRPVGPEIVLGPTASIRIVPRRRVGIPTATTPIGWRRIQSNKWLLDRDPIDGARLASQPTISRFEQSVSPRTPYRLGEALADTVIGRHRRRHRTARLISGVAAALIADAEARLAESGVATAWLACAIENERAARFYDKCGRHRAGTMINPAETPTGTFPLEVWRHEKSLTRSA